MGVGLELGTCILGTGWNVFVWGCYLIATGSAKLHLLDTVTMGWNGSVGILQIVLEGLDIHSRTGL